MFGRWSLYSHNWQNPYSGLNNSYHYNNGTYYNGYGEVVPFSRVHNYIDYKLGLGKWVTLNRWSEKGKGGYYLGELTSMAVWVLRGRDPMNESQEVEPSTSDYLEFFARISLGMTPDAISISGDIDVYAGGGTSASVAGFLIMLKGKNPGSYTLYSDVGAGGGIPGASAMITLTKYYFVGVDLNDIIIESIEDRRTNIGFSLGEGVVVGAGITSMVAPNGGYIFGVSYSIGFGGGFPVSVNINGGNTFFWP